MPRRRRISSHGGSFRAAMSVVMERVREARRDSFLDADSKAAAAAGGALVRGCFSDAARMMETLRLPSLPVAKVRVTLAHPPERRSRV